MHISDKGPKRVDVQFIVETIKEKTCLLENLSASKSWETLLVTSTLDIMAPYYMQASFIPTTTLKDIHKLLHKFYLGNYLGQVLYASCCKGYHCKAKTYGRRGVWDS